MNSLLMGSRISWWTGYCGANSAGSCAEREGAMMREAEVVKEFRGLDWEGPFDAAMRAQAGEALESGKVLIFPDLPFRLVPGEEAFLSPALADQSRKNISFDPISGRVGASTLSGMEEQRLGAMLDRFGRQARSLLVGLIPGYARGLERARTSYRPIEIEQRPTSPRHDDRRLHVDAFPTRPMAGRRILRVFSNIAPDGAVRQWEVGEPFAAFAEKFFPRLSRPWPGTAWTMERLGLTKGRRTPYDFLMLGLHDRAKLDNGYQRDAPRFPLGFPPGVTWIVYTDQVLHAALAGRFALEQTFHLPPDVMIYPEKTPLRVLERLAARPLIGA